MARYTASTNPNDCSNMRNDPGYVFVYMAFCFLSLGLICTSFALAIVGANESVKVEASFSDLVSNWNEDLIYGITADPNFAVPSSNYYLRKWVGFWPGTENGCYCPERSRDMRVEAGLKAKTCSQNETLSKCKDIAPTEGKDLDKWTNSKPIYTIRMKGSNFLENYQSMDTTGNCLSTDLMLCGKKSSVSKGICLSKSKFSSCPLTDVSDTSKSGYIETVLSGFSLFSTNSADFNPISDARILEHHMCFVRAHMPLTPGRKPYLLHYGQYDACQEDKSAWSVGQMGEKTFLDLNAVPYQGLTQFEPSDSNKYNLMLGRILEWSPLCYDTVPTMSEKKKDLQEIAYQFFVLRVTYAIAFSFAVILIILLFCLVRANKRQLYKYSFVGRVCMFILPFPSLVLTLHKTKVFVDYFNKIVDLQCTSEQSNANFQSSIDFIKNRLGLYSILALVFSIICIVVDCLLCFYFLRRTGPVYSPEPVSDHSNHTKQPATDEGSELNKIKASPSNNPDISPSIPPKDPNEKLAPMPIHAKPQEENQDRLPKITDHLGSVQRASDTLNLLK